MREFYNLISKAAAWLTLAGWPGIVGAAGIRRRVVVGISFVGGFAPNDTPPIGGGAFQASHQRPFYMGLKINVPPGARVDNVSGAEPASWITPEAQ